MSDKPPAPGEPRVPRQRLARAVPGYLAAGIALILLHVLSVGWLCYLNMTAAIEAEALENHTYVVIGEWSELLSSVKDAETGQRGFIITGDKAYLEPYHASLGEIERHLDYLRRLTADNPRQQQRLAAIAPLVAAKLAKLKENLAIREAAGLQAASEAVAQGHGRKLMDELRALVGEAAREEQRLLQDRVAKKEADTRETIQWVVIGDMLGSVALLLMFFLLRREFMRRRRVEFELRAHQDQLTKLVDERTNELRESERTARAVVDGLTAHIATVDERGCILAVNARWRDFAKENDAVLLDACEGANYLAVCDEAAGEKNPEAAAVAAGIRDVLARKSAEFAAEYPCHSPTEERWFTVRVTPFPGEGPRRAVISHENISARVQAERVAREKEAQLRAADRRLAEIMHGMTEACFALDREWRFAFVNDRCESLLRHRRDEMLGRPIWDVFHKLVGTPMEKNYRRAMAERVPVSFETFSPIAERWLDIRLFPSGDGLAAFLLDIHQRKQAEEETRRTHAELDTWLRTAPVGFCYFDRELRYVRINDRLAEMNGLPAEAHIGRHVSEIVPTLADAVRDMTQRLLATGEAVYDHEFSGETAAMPGVKRYWNESWYPVHNGGNEVIGFGVVVVEITERKRAEEVLRASNSRLKQVLEIETVGVMFWDLATGVMIDANSTFLKVMGYSRREVEARELTWQKLTPPEYVEASLAEWRKFAVTGRVGPDEKEYFRKDGSRQWFVFAGSALGDGTCVEFCVDVSDRKRTEQALAESKSRLEGIVGSAMDAIVSVDSAQRIVLFNAAAEKMFRCTAREAIGCSIERFIPAPFHAGHAGYIRRFGETGVSNRAMGRLDAISGLRADGEEFPIEASLSQTDAVGEKLFTVILRDVTERTRTEAAATMRARQQAAVVDLSHHALAGRDLNRLMNDSVALVAQVLGVEFAKLLELTEAGDELLLRAGVGWRDGLVGSKKVPAGGESQAGYTLLSNAPVVVEDLTQETRFHGPALLTEHGVVSGMTVIIGGRSRPYGVLGTHSTERRSFSSDDVHFLQSIADLLATALERRQLEEELLAATGREQRRLGQDLHDGLCQHLAGIEFRNEALALDLEDDPPAREEVEKIGALLREGTRQARMLARGLAPVELEKNGLMSALTELAENSAHLYRIECRFLCEQPVLVTDEATATHLYRIAQEAISNAVRHARAKVIDVTLRRLSDEAVLTVVNDGAPLPAELGRVGGMGLRIMRYRTELIGATLRMGSTAEGKTELSCTFKPNG